MKTLKERLLSSEHIYRDLTTGILVFFVLGPFLTWMTGNPNVHGYLSVAFLLFALYEITRRASDVAIGLALGLPAVASGLVNSYTPDTPAINFVPTILAILFTGFLIWRILKDVLVGSRITHERIFGAICAYLLFGFLFAEIYGFVALVDNDAFAVSDNLRARRVGGDDPSMWQGVLTYFSFVTMTTLGYGDMSPVSAAARTLAWLQALIGQLYLTVTIAGLVGIHVSGKTR